jgi:hypothetical protein
MGEVDCPSLSFIGFMFQRLNQAAIEIISHTAVQSQSYLATDSQSTSLSWYQATIRARDKFFFLLEIFVRGCGFVILLRPL